MKQLSPLAQSVSKTASKMNSTIFRTPILSKDNFMFPKPERHTATMTQGAYTNPWRITEQSEELFKPISHDMIKNKNFPIWNITLSHTQVTSAVVLLIAAQFSCHFKTFFWLDKVFLLS